MAIKVLVCLMLKAIAGKENTGMLRIVFVFKANFVCPNWFLCAENPNEEDGYKTSNQVYFLTKMA